MYEHNWLLLLLLLGCAATAAGGVVVDWVWDTSGVVMQVTAAYVATGTS